MPAPPMRCCCSSGCGYRSHTPLISFLSRCRLPSLHASTAATAQAACCSHAQTALRHFTLVIILAQLKGVVLVTSLGHELGPDPRTTLLSCFLLPDCPWVAGNLSHPKCTCLKQVMLGMANGMAMLCRHCTATMHPQPGATSQGTHPLATPCTCAP